MSTAAESPALPPFTGMALDRASTERKDAEWVRARMADPASRVIAAGHDGLLVAGAAPPELARGRVPEGRLPEPILLGLDDAGAALFALDVEALTPEER